MPITFNLDKSQAQDIAPLVHVTDKMIAMPIEIEGSAEIFTKVEQTAIPAEGMESYYKWIGTNINYPQEARTKGEQGKVFVHFIVKQDGSLDDIKVIKGVSPEIDAEALRVVKNHPQQWKAGEHNGVKVNQRIVMPITFSLKEPNKGMLNNEIKIKAIEGIRKDASSAKDGMQPEYTVVAHQ
jgi:TonB family protein